MQTCSETRFLEKHSMKVRLNQNWKTFYNVQKFMPAVPNPELLGGLLGNFCSSNRLIQLTDLVVVFYREIPSSCFSQCKANEEQFALKKQQKTQQNFNATMLAWLLGQNTYMPNWSFYNEIQVLQHEQRCSQISVAYRTLLFYGK